jgi:hypothetical protein
MGKILGENDMAYRNTCIYIVSLKTFYEKSVGKTHQGKRVQYIYDLKRSSMGYNKGVYSP